MTPEPKTAVKGDRALHDGDEDKLGFREIAERIAASLIDHASDGGLVVGLEGAWGSGKSSLLFLIEDALAKLPKEQRPAVITFRPWLVGNRDALLANLFVELSKKIDQVALEAGDASRHSATKVRAAAEALRKFAAGLGKAGAAIEVAGDAVGFVYDSLTKVEHELWLVGGALYIAILPQILTYILSGLSGSASPPLFIRQATTIAIWSLVKFFAGLGGIWLSQPVANLVLGVHVSTSDFIAGSAVLALAFITATIYLQVIDHDYEVEFALGVHTLHVKIPVSQTLRWIHTSLTKHRRPTAGQPLEEEQPTVSTEITIPLAGLWLPPPIKDAQVVVTVKATRKPAPA